MCPWWWWWPLWCEVSSICIIFRIRTHSLWNARNRNCWHTQSGDGGGIDEKMCLRYKLIEPKFNLAHSSGSHEPPHQCFISIEFIWQNPICCWLQLSLCIIDTSVTVLKSNHFSSIDRVVLEKTNNAKTNDETYNIPTRNLPQFCFSVNFHFRVTLVCFHNEWLHFHCLRWLNEHHVTLTPNAYEYIQTLQSVDTSKLRKYFETMHWNIFDVVARSLSLLTTLLVHPLVVDNVNVLDDVWLRN